MKNPIDIAIKAAGSLTELAKRIHATPSQICNWRNRGTPASKCAAVESAVLRAVTRKDLRPDDWQSHWPELIPKTKK